MTQPNLDELYRYAGEDGRVFRVTFIKRNGEKRDMVCRTGVEQHLRGGTLPYNPREHGLYTVFDMHKRDYRMVPTDPSRVIEVRGRGKILYHRKEAEDVVAQ